MQRVPCSPAACNWGRCGDQRSLCCLWSGKAQSTHDTQTGLVPDPEQLLSALQEGSQKGANSALTSFQSMVSNELAKMESSFQSGGKFPGIPAIQDPKLFQVSACPLLTKFSLPALLD